MKKIIYLFILLFLFTFRTQAQHPWDNIISPARAADWTVTGLPPTISYGTGGSACNGTSVNCIETTTNPWTVPARVQGGSTITCANTSADPTTINSALSASKPGNYVLFTGNCDINANIIMVSGVSLRGTSPQTAQLNVTGASTIFQFGTCCGGVQSGVFSATSYAQGTNSITINSATCNTSCSDLVVGNAVYFEQCDTGWTGTGTSFSTDPSCTSGSYVDNGGVWICGFDYPQCSQNNSPSGGHAFQRQYSLITGVTNSGAGSYTVTFSPGLYMPNWSSSNNGIMFWIPRSTETFGAAIEDATLNFSFNTGEKVSLEPAIAWWLKGDRIIGVPNISNIDYGSTMRGLFFNNYVFSQNANELSSGHNEPIVRGSDSNDLLLNNIIHGGICIWSNGLTVGDVMGYNYCRDAFTDYPSSVTLNHSPYQSFTLTEGNQTSLSDEDDTHGTNGLDIWFRNYYNGSDGPYSTYLGTNSVAMQVGNYQRGVTFIGNVLGGPSLTGAYQTASTFRSIYIVSTTDSLAAGTLMRWGNVDTVTGGPRWCGNSSSPGWVAHCSSTSEIPTGLTGNAAIFNNLIPSSTTLPCSLFLAGYTSTSCSSHPSGGTGLSWWKVCTAWTTFPTACATYQTNAFPAAGPDVTGGAYVSGYAGDIPAATAWKTLPIDTSLQNSFTITGSSWSASCTFVSGAAYSCETLTVSLSSINNGSMQNIIGGFQLSGVNSACLPTSGVSFTGRSDNEIIMSGSSLTTIIYALPSVSSDPGCTGTLKFPDIRQFDERVFQFDSGSGTVTLSPSSENFGTFTVFTSSSPVTFTLTNGSSTAATSITPSLTGANTGDFLITNSGAGSCQGAGNTITASASCTFTITATPQASGTRTANVSVTYSGGDSLSPQVSTLQVTGSLIPAPTGLQVVAGGKVAAGGTFQ